MVLHEVSCYWSLVTHYAVKIRSLTIPGGTPLYKPVCAAPKGMVFEPFWSENGKIGYGLQGNHESV